MKAPDQLLAVIDANSSGVSGDKYLGALVNMGGRVESLRKGARVVAEYLPGTSRVEVEARKVERGGLRGQPVTCKSQAAGLRPQRRLMPPPGVDSATKSGHAR